MMKYVMKTGAVSVALATAALFAPTALSAPDSQTSSTHKVDHTSRNNGSGHEYNRQSRSHDGYNRGRSHHDRWGAHDRHNRYDRYGNRGRHRSYITRHERYSAVRLCERAIDHRASHRSHNRYTRVDYLGQPHVTRSVRAGHAINVRGPARIHNGRGHTIVQSECTIRHGRVVDLDLRRASRHRGYSGQSGVGFGIRFGLK